jgi:hypothetical protein
LVATLTLAAQAAWAQNLNVSRIATSYRSLSWSEEASTLSSPFIGTITYFEWARARSHNDARDYLSASSWNFNWTSTPSYPTITRSVATPPPYQQNGNQYTYDSPFYSRGLVDMWGAEKFVKSATFSTGWATAAVNYSARVEHSSSTPLDYFILLHHPTLTRGVAAGSSLQPGGPGGSGGTILTKWPDSARSRTAIDVLVNGLPVWSSESTYLYPEGNAQNPTDRRETSWGNPVTTGEQTKLYLGKLSAGSSLNITFIVRTDAHATAPDCGTWYSANYDYTYNHEWRCFQVNESVQLNGTTSGNPVSFRVYAKQLNTSPLIAGPFNF